MGSFGSLHEVTLVMRVGGSEEYNQLFVKKAVRQNREREGGKKEERKTVCFTPHSREGDEGKNPEVNAITLFGGKPERVTKTVLCGPVPANVICDRGGGKKGSKNKKINLNQP